MTQEGESLSVSMTTRGGEEVNGKGTVQDGQISWTLSFERERGKLIITYSGRIQENGMKGRVTYGTFGSGKWSAKAQ